jgi:hypothetical protein
VTYYFVCCSTETVAHRLIVKDAVEEDDVEEVTDRENTACVERGY